MKLSTQLAKKFRAVYLERDWVVATSLKAQLADVNWIQATTQINSLNSLAALVFHLNYYLAGILKVMGGGPLDIRDKYSFDMPPVESEDDWKKLLNKLWSDAEKFATIVEKMPDEKLKDNFSDGKYGSYDKNIRAMIEHSYYHLGQIALIKKMVLQAG